MSSKETALPIEVLILTPDHEVRGLIHVSGTVAEDRRLTDLLNDPKRRFLAVTDAHLVNRVGPSTPRLYSFLQLHMDNIIMIHPAKPVSTSQSKKSSKSAEHHAERLETFRGKLNKTLPL